MSSGTAKEYEDFARDCVRLANQADSPELREKLLNLAREWMHAVMDVEDAASAKEGQWSKAPKQRSSGGSDLLMSTSRTRSDAQPGGATIRPICHRLL